MKPQDNVDALFAVAYSFQKKGDFFKAIGAYKQLLTIKPKHASAHNNLGNCLRSIGRFAEALGHYQYALAIEPDRRSTILNQSLAHLALNEYEKAWPGYEARLPTIEFRKEVLNSGCPQWDGRPLKNGERLFVYSNQGIGDELQTMRYLPLVTQLADHVIFEVHQGVHRMAQAIPGLAEVLVRPKAKNGPLPEFDYHCEIFSLPKIFQTRFDRIPIAYRPPYEPDAKIVEFISEQRAQHPDKKHIGLVWSGNPKNETNPFRACGLVHYLPLLEMEGFRFYSLQKGLPRNDIKQFRPQSDGLVDMADHLTDMVATATAIDELDLLISTDTSVPHLAGTIGAKSWVLLHQPADWRWTVDKDKTPWYPQMRLFRQERPRYWVSLIDEVKEALLSWHSNG